MDNFNRNEKMRVLVKEFFQDLSAKSRSLTFHKETVALLGMNQAVPEDVFQLILEQVEIDMKYMTDICSLLRSTQSPDTELDEVKEKYISLLKENNALNSELSKRGQELLLSKNKSVSDMITSLIGGTTPPNRDDLN